jgi:hypothetical protein
VRDILDAGPGRAPGADDDEPFALEGPLGGLVAALRAPADLGPGVDAAVMAAVRLAPPLAVVPGGAVAARPLPRRREGAFARGARWLARPRQVRISPLGALAAAGIAIAALFGLRRDTERPGELAATGEHPVTATGEFPVPAAARTRDTIFVTRFVLVAPDAKQVSLVGDFNDWDQAATPLVPVAQGTQGGVWTVELPLRAGRYSYAFLVDGHRWQADPAAPRAVGDDFGRPSSVVTVRGA